MQIGSLECMQTTPVLHSDATGSEEQPAVHLFSAHSLDVKCDKGKCKNVYPLVKVLHVQNLHNLFLNLAFIVLLEIARRFVVHVDISFPRTIS